MGLYESLTYYKTSIITVSAVFLFSIIIMHLSKFFCLKSQVHKVVLFSGFIRRFMIIFPVSYMAAIRTTETGADTYNVIRSYHLVTSLSFWEAVNWDDTAILYNIIRWIVGKISSGNEVLFLFIISAIPLYIVVLTIEQWEIQYPCFSLFIFYFTFGLILFDQIRQLIAVTILLYGYKFAYEKKTKVYLLISLIAGLFHLSSFFAGLLILFVCRFEFSKENNTKEIIFLFIVLMMTIFISPIINWLGTLFSDSKYSVYFQEQTDLKLGLGLVLSLIPSVFPATIIIPKMGNSKKHYNTIFFTFPIRLAGYISFFLSRMMYYFSIITVIAFPKAIGDTIHSSNKKFIAVITSFSVILYYILFYCWKMADVYFPYRTIFD